VLLRRRQLLADGAPVELGTRAIDLLLVLLEADGSLVTKQQLLSRVWPGIVVSEENFKGRVAALRKALGADRDVIRTEVGRGYRFIGVLRSNTARDANQRPARPKQRFGFHRVVGTRSAGFRFEMTCQSARGKPGIATPDVCRTRQSGLFLHSSEPRGTGSER
jgi:DNA-binding winged helix-turn-helix (wHTH) protein